MCNLHEGAADGEDVNAGLLEGGVSVDLVVMVKKNGRCCIMSDAGWSHGLRFLELVTVLPKKFIDHFKGELLETIELKVPSGDKWHVELKKTGDGVVLDCGWTNFVAAYGILENDTLVFKYDGRSSFIVLIFEQSGCEKAASHCAMRKDGMEELCAIASGKKDRHPCYESSPRTSEQPKQLAMFQKILRANRDAKEKHLKRRMNTMSTKRILRQKNFTGTRGKKSLNEQESEIKQGTMNLSNEVSLAKQWNPKDFIISKKARLTDAVKNIVLHLAETNQTDKPTFVSIMVPSCISKRFYLTIPIAFAIQYLPRASGRVLLQLNGKERTWPVHCLVQGNSVGFSSGWKEFVQYNQLNVGDVCIFEMLEAQERVLMAVHINKIQ
ncbi:hypothetical protein KFK09_014657 [Dendrobium nobile]|uniref:TF-B3 domain-containing protein n=1 Tax=Dendrobium nobile TaxID=94219 RepID=A0A8T3B3R6_DENNO|nr:hypothetical protein KFK09_014657 [Dendrobium nobile]